MLFSELYKIMVKSYFRSFLGGDRPTLDPPLHGIDTKLTNVHRKRINRVTRETDTGIFAIRDRSNGSSRSVFRHCYVTSRTRDASYVCGYDDKELMHARCAFLPWVAPNPSRGFARF